MLPARRRSSALKASPPASAPTVRDARGRVHCLGEVGQHLRRLGAVAVQSVERLDRRLRVAAEDLLEQVEDAAAVGETQHVAHGRGRYMRPAPMAIA